MVLYLIRIITVYIDRENKDEKMIQCYAAPMEGITGYVYRNVHAKYFQGMDKYFTPFITPRIKKVWMNKEKRDISPDHNQGLPIVPQILTNKADELVRGAEDLFHNYGYQEVNLNLGCPSGTVASKGRGSGFLRYPEELQRFFEEYFSQCQVPLSIKTRLGMFHGEEFPALMDIFNQFPFTEVIVHARVREDYYKNPVNLDAFEAGYQSSRHPLIYNGDIYGKSDLDKLLDRFPKISCVMVGRGMIADPQLVEKLKFGNARDLKRLKAFMDELCDSYQDILSGDKNALFKMKEIWFYMENQFTSLGNYGKKIKKSKTLAEYRALVDALFAEEMSSELH